MCMFFKRNYLGLQKFLLLIQPLLVFVARNCGDLYSWHWNPGVEWGWDSLPRDIHLEFLFTSPFHVCVPPTILDECGLFNSVVARLSFNSISESSE